MPVSGFHAPQEFPDKMTVSKDEVNVEGYDGTYILNKDSQMLSLNVSIANKSFYYELEYNLLYLKDSNDANSEVGIYLNLSKASEEEVYEYSFGKSVAEENRLEEYLIGKWKCTGKGRKGRDLSGEYGSSTDYYIEFTEDDEGRHVRYNLPVPHREEDDSGYDIRDENKLTLGSEKLNAFQFTPKSEEDDSGYDIRDENKLTLGSEKLNAFQFTPKSEEEMAVYCYDNDSYYDFEREY